MKKREEKDIASHDKDITSKISSVKKILKALGPGIITGASDDDPSTIATFSQAGAQFGFGMLWLALFQYPMKTVIQEICARIGLVSGKGLSSAIKKRYSKNIVLPLTILLIIANTVNIGADIAAMSASIRLVFPHLPVIVAALSFPAFAMMFVAMFGTAISPYLFFWQASEEAEEEVEKHKIKEIGKGKPKISKKDIMLMRQDTAIGMAFSQIIMWAIITTTAGSLHTHGVTDIQSADQAAKALQPLLRTFPQAGEISKTIFAIGIIGTGLLAVPVLAGSSGYALSDVFEWNEGLSKTIRQAKGFYLIIAASTLIGLWMNFTNIDPIKALVYAAVINGIIAVPILFAVMKIANDKKVLRDYTNNRVSNVIGWLTFGITGMSIIIMLVSWGKQ